MDDSFRERSRTPRPELFLAIPALGIFALWGTSDGGFDPAGWYPGGLFLLGLLALAMLVRRRDGPQPGLVAGAAIALAAFVAWSYLSIIWAGVPADAWEGANRALVYFAAFALFALPTWRAASAAIFLGAFSVVVAVIGVVALAGIAGDADPALAFLDGRMTEPAGYHNASAALMLLALWPAAALSARPEVPPIARGVLLAAAGVLLQLAVLPQSRGAVVAFAVTLVVYGLAVRGRLRAVLWLIPLAVALALGAPPLLDVYDVLQAGEDAGGAVDAALRTVLVSALVLAAGGTLLAFAERRVRVSERRARIVNRAAAGLAALAVLGAIAAGIAAVGNPVSWADERWQDFKGGYDLEQLESSRFSGSLGTNRYDFWRVSMSAFAESPFLGTGMDNFAVEYLQDRRSEEEPRHPHSLPVKVVSQTGIVGAILFVAALGLAAAAAIRRRRETSSGLAAAAAAGAITSVAYFLVHASADWLWAFPGIAAPAFALLALAGRVRSDEATKVAPEDEPGRRWPLYVGAAVLLVAAAATLVVPLLAARETERALATWRDDPQAAYAELDRARDLNPLSDRPDLVAASIALSGGDSDLALDRFESALERNPSNWYAAAQAAALLSTREDSKAATERAELALRLNPRDPVVRRMEQRISRGRPVSAKLLTETVTERVCTRVGRTRATPDCDPSDG